MLQFHIGEEFQLIVGHRKPRLKDISISVATRYSLMKTSTLVDMASESFMS
jgi:hypothetical protein